VDVSSLRFMRAAGWLAVPPDCFLAPDVWRYFVFGGVGGGGGWRLSLIVHQGS
jgi:hypothetical protein